MSDKPLVTITGISGYLGAHTCLLFLKDGSYRVRGTVRSTSNESKIKPMREAFGAFFDQLELFEADLNDEESIIASCEGATYLIHTASPFAFTGDVVGPAVAGTTAAMKAASKHGLKTVVVTSSVAAIMAQPPAEKPDPDKGQAYDETWWSQPEFLQSGAMAKGFADYLLSKTLAEKVAWDYQKENPGFDVVTINPWFVLGPSLLAGDGVSEGFIKAVLDGSKAKIPRGHTNMVDVRDCALAHLKAIQVPEAANKRFLLWCASVEYTDAYAVLAPYNEKGAKVPLELADGDNEKVYFWNNASSKEVLGITYTPWETTLVDMADAFLASGKLAK